MFAPRRSTAPGDADGATLTDGIKVSRLAKKQDSDLDVEKSGVEKLMAVFKQGLFGVLFVMAKDASVHHSWHYVLVFFHFLQVRGPAGRRITLLPLPRLSAVTQPSLCVQLMSFPLSASNDLPWQHQPILRWLCQFLTSLSLTKRVLGNRTLSTVACFCGLGWICGLLACAFWVGRAFIRENFVVLWPIKVCGRGSGAGGRGGGQGDLGGYDFTTTFPCSGVAHGGHPLHHPHVHSPRRRCHASVCV